MAVLKFQQAREVVIEQLRSCAPPEKESVALSESLGRVLAEPVFADRDFPPFPRSTRDGFAVRSADVREIPARLRLIGQVRAGSQYHGTVGMMECVEIMTGAPVPEGADAVVMIEYTAPGQIRFVEVQRGVKPFENIVPRGSEARAGDLLVPAGRRIRYAEIATMASVGRQTISVFRRPRVAILSTGDEVVDVSESPGPFQIRNSNSYALQAQVTGAEATPLLLGIVPDREDQLREKVAAGLEADLLLLSGGVSMGKFDLVEKVLAEFGAEFFFDGVAIRPGKPVVFGRARGKFFFGLPGNPLSAMLTFELFARPAIALLSGESDAPLHFLRARLTSDVRPIPGLTVFIPALLAGDPLNSTVSSVGSKGSGDIPSLARANCYIVVPDEGGEPRAGDWVAVLPR